MNRNRDGCLTNGDLCLSLRFEQPGFLIFFARPIDDLAVIWTERKRGRWTILSGLSIMEDASMLDAEKCLMPKRACMPKYDCAR